MVQDQTTFNEAAYLDANPDVARAIGQPGVESAWDHFQNFGKREGRQGFFVEPQQEAEKSNEGNERYFNEAAYLAANPDVAAAIGQPGVESGYQHYINFGQNEGRKASFDVSESTARINELSNEIYNAYKTNSNYDAQYKELQSLKDEDPASYYTAQLKFLGQQVGWQIGQNTNERSAPAREQIQGLLPEAINAGLSPDTVDSILNTSVNTANIENQRRIINEQQSGGSGFNLRETLLGIAPVAALAIGAPFLDAALAAGTAGASAATAGAGAGGSIGGISLGGAFVPTVGSGASFALPGALAAGAGAGAGGLEAYMAAAGLNPGTFSGANFVLPAGAGGSIGGIDLGGAFTPTPGSGASFTLPASTTSGLMGPTYQELGVTGVEGGLAGPTYAELGYTGLNNAEAIAAADAAAKAASLSSLLDPKLLTQGLKIGGSLLGGGAEQPQPQGAAPRPQSIMPRGQVDYSGILNLLQVPSPQRNMYSLLG